ncbi:MAG: branched-chain amino acid transaminase [Acidobacteriota bacterium]
MAFTETKWVWMNGRMIAWDEAQVHSSTHALHYGTGVFEGTRAYLTERGTAVFRLSAHMDRLFASAETYGMEIPFTRDQLVEATHAVIAKNGFGNCYLRHLCYLESANLGIRAECPVGFLILVWRFENPHGAKGIESGIRATISPWRKFSSDMMPTTAKASGQYLNSRLAVSEAAKRGFDEAILLDTQGNVAEASIANVFLVRDGRLITNDEKSSILLGITRRSVIELARDLGYRVDITTIRVSDLLEAEEVFVTGTASEVIPVRQIDGKSVGSGTRGPVTTALQRAFFDATAGRNALHADWLELATGDSSLLVTHSAESGAGIL